MGESRFMEGFIIGALAGAVVALLYAPQSGEETRAWIKKVKDENEEVIEKAKESSETMIATTKAAINDGLEKLSATLEEKKRGVRKKSAS